MAFTSFISEIKSKILGSDKPKPLAKIKPIFDTWYTPDLETGDEEFYKRLKARQSALEYDLEKGDDSIICDEILIDINGYKNNKFIEKYISLMDVIKYISSPIIERESKSLLPFVVEYMSESSPHIAIDIEEDNLVDDQLHLPA